MKRYLLFAWFAFEAQGGWRDFQSSWATPEPAKKEARCLITKGCAHAQVVDARTGKKVYEV